MVHEILEIIIPTIRELRKDVIIRTGSRPGCAVLLFHKHETRIHTVIRSISRNTRTPLHGDRVSLETTMIIRDAMEKKSESRVRE